MSAAFAVGDRLKWVFSRTQPRGTSFKRLLFIKFSENGSRLAVVSWHLPRTCCTSISEVEVLWVLAWMHLSPPPVASLPCPWICALVGVFLRPNALERSVRSFRSTTALTTCRVHPARSLSMWERFYRSCIGWVSVAGGAWPTCDSGPPPKWETRTCLALCQLCSALLLTRRVCDSFAYIADVPVVWSINIFPFMVSSSTLYIVYQLKKSKKYPRTCSLTFAFEQIL